VIFFKLLIALLVTGAIVTNYTPPDHGAVLAIASPLATVAAMLFGFVIASVTFFSASSENTLIVAMKDTNMYSNLLIRLHRTGVALITSCLFMVIAIFSPSKIIMMPYIYKWDFILLTLGFFFLIYALIEFWTCWKRVNVVSSHM
jgi:hypothetical protein